MRTLEYLSVGAVLLYFCASCEARTACMMAYADDQCATLITANGETNVDGVDECQAFTIAGIPTGAYKKLTCVGDTLALGFYQDSACTVPNSVNIAGQDYSSYGVTGCGTVSTQPGVQQMAQQFGFPTAVSYRAQCFGCPPPPPPGSPGTSAGYGASGYGDGGDGGTDNGGKGGKGTGDDEDEEEGGGVTFLLFLLVVAGISTACSCYWCTCCPWYQHRMGLKDPIQAVEMHTDVEHDMSGLAAYDENRLSLGEPGAVVVTGVPVDSPPSYAPTLTEEEPDDSETSR